MKSKINLKSAIGILAAVVAGVVAFLGEVDNQRKDKMIEDMDRRITELEGRES